MTQSVLSRAEYYRLIGLRRGYKQTESLSVLSRAEYYRLIGLWRGYKRQNHRITE
jgi:hypothetical protein